MRIKGDILGLQTGHGKQVAGMVHARELQQGTFGMALQREHFRKVSRQWHWCLGSGAEDWGLGGGAEAGARRERAGVFDSMRGGTAQAIFGRLQLNPALREWGVHRAFLMATLVPQDEGRFTERRDC